MKLIESIVVYQDNDLYCSHPCVTTLSGGEWLVAFSAAPQGDSLRHPPDYPEYVNLLLRSADQGQTWSDPQTIPNDDWHGVEVPAIAQISTGELLLSQWRFRWRPIEDVMRSSGDGTDQWFYFDQAIRRWRPVTDSSEWGRHPFPYARADDGAYIHISSDRGHTWPETIPVEIAPYQGAFGLKGVVELADGVLIMPMGSHDHDPSAANFIVRSEDQGRTWSKPIEVARTPGLVFSEPSALVTSSGRLLMFSREETTGYIHQSFSEDGGVTWSAPRRLPLWGYPTQGIELEDGRTVIVYGHRRKPFGILAAVSTNRGDTWDQEIVIRSDLADTYSGHNLGYPSVIEYEPGSLFVVYYAEDGSGTTCIQGSYLRL